jgi:hypothetical protein
MSYLKTPEVPRFEESLRYFLNSPIPGEIYFEDDVTALEHGFIMDKDRFHDLEAATLLIETNSPEVTADNLPPASFRADTVLIVASMLGSRLGKNYLSEEEVLEADRIIFQGGQTHWLGLDIETRPLFQEMLETNQVDVISSRDVAKYIADSIEGVSGPSLLGEENPSSLMGEDAHTQKLSLGGRLLQRLLKQGPSEQVRDADLAILIEHFEETGQVLLGTDDQFVHKGDVQQGSKAFWLLQLHEASQVPLSQTTNQAGNIVVKYYQDGSRRTEMYTEHNNKAKIIFEAPGSVVNFGDQRAEEPVLSVVAGYEQFKRIPYLPDWMKETEIANIPASVLLDVYTDRYVISIVD